jgi:O-antigen ligase
VAVLVLPLFLPLLPVPLPIKTSVSYYRRADLALASYKIFYNYPLFGVGFGGFTKLAESYTSLGSVIRFDQPVHNLFLLIASESGVFAVLLFLAFLSVVFAQSSRGKNVAVVRIFELQFLLLAGFDHYFLSSQQLMLLFWLVAGLLCSKELDNVSYL